MTEDLEMEVLAECYPDRTVTYIAARGSFACRVTYNGTRLAADAVRMMNWVDGTPLHHKAPRYIGEDKRRLNVIEFRPSAFEPDSLSWDAPKKTPQHFTTMQLITDTLDAAIMGTTHLTGHEIVDLRKKSERHLDFLKSLLEHKRSFARRQKEAATRAGEHFGVNVLTTTPEDGTRARILQPDLYKYADMQPDGISEIERVRLRERSRICLRGVEGPHKGMLLRKTRNMRLYHAAEHGVAPKRQDPQ